MLYEYLKENYSVGVCGRILTNYIQAYGITKSMVDKYIGEYPLKVYKAIYETG